MTKSPRQLASPKKVASSALARTCSPSGSPTPRPQACSKRARPIPSTPVRRSTHLNARATPVVPHNAPVGTAAGAASGTGAPPVQLQPDITLLQGLGTTTPPLRRSLEFPVSSPLKTPSSTVISVPHAHSALDVLPLDVLPRKLPITGLQSPFQLHSHGGDPPAKPSASQSRDDTPSTMKTESGMQDFEIRTTLDDTGERAPSAIRLHDSTTVSAATQNYGGPLPLLATNSVGRGAHDSHTQADVSHHREIDTVPAAKDGDHSALNLDLGPQVSTDIGLSVDANVPPNVDANIRANIGATVRANVTAKLNTNVDENVDANVNLEVIASIDADADPNIVARIGANVNADLNTDVGAHINTNISSKVRADPRMVVVADTSANIVSENSLHAPQASAARPLTSGVSSGVVSAQARTPSAEGHAGPVLFSTVGITGKYAASRVASSESQDLNTNVRTDSHANASCDARANVGAMLPTDPGAGLSGQRHYRGLGAAVSETSMRMELSRPVATLGGHHSYVEAQMAAPGFALQVASASSAHEEISTKTCEPAGLAHHPPRHSDDHVHGQVNIQARARYASSVRAAHSPSIPAQDALNDHAEHLLDNRTEKPHNLPAEHLFNDCAGYPLNVRVEHPPDLFAQHPVHDRAEHPPYAHAEDPANVSTQHLLTDCTEHPPNFHAEPPVDVCAEPPVDVCAEDPSDVPAKHPSNVPADSLANFHAEHLAHVRADHLHALPSDRTATNPTVSHSDDRANRHTEIQSSGSLTRQHQSVFDSDDEDHPQAVGRISHESLKHLDAAYELVLEKAKEVRQKTGLSIAQIFEHWLAATGSRTQTKPNLWNLYSAYFKENTAKELARLHAKNLHEDRDPVPSPTRSSDSYDAIEHLEDEDHGSSNQGHASGTRQLCYKAFQRDYGAEKAKAILETFRQLQGANVGQSQTVAQCRTIFKKHSTKLTDLMNAGEQLHGFSGALLLVGSSVNSDAGLATVHMTKNAEGFFEDKCRADEDTIIGHMRALTRRERPSEGVMKASKSAMSTPVVKSKWCAPSPAPSPTKSATNAGCDSDDEDVLLDRKERPKYIASRLRTLLDEAGVKGISGSLFPWKSLPSILASNGVLLRNWPENVPWPLDSGTSAAKSSKGISSLKSNELVALLTALKDQKHRIKFEAHPGNRIDLIKSRIPVMHGVPPPHTSGYPNGRRLFANGTTDRAGLPRLAAPLGVQIGDRAKPGADAKPGANAASPGADIFGSPDSSPSPDQSPFPSIQTRSKVKRAPLPFKKTMVTIDTSPNKRRSPQTDAPPEIFELSSSDEYKPSDSGPTDQPSKRASKKRKAPPSFIASDDLSDDAGNSAAAGFARLSKGKARATDVGMRERTPTPPQKTAVSSHSQVMEDGTAKQPPKKRVRHADVPDSVASQAAHATELRRPVKPVALDNVHGNDALMASGMDVDPRTDVRGDGRADPRIDGRKDVRADLSADARNAAHADLRSEVGSHIRGDVRGDSHANVSEDVRVNPDTDTRIDAHTNVPEDIRVDSISESQCVEEMAITLHANPHGGEYAGPHSSRNALVLRPRSPAQRDNSSGPSALNYGAAETVSRAAEARKPPAGHEHANHAS
ncbi:hypothetical protein BV20DRAFT_1058254 [Pilatotrama ljubarskyi]|nr:hypothetical protein BV20DRAFT_1058254 [Pilatotrama ljubarskyi]